MSEVRPCDSPCPKCGSLEVSRQFNAKGETVKPKAYGKTLNKYCSNRCGTWHNEVIRDHIQNHCKCCHFEWPLLPMKKATKK